MRLAPKLSLLLAAASAGPLLAAAVSLPLHARALRRQLEVQHAQSAASLASDVDRQLRDKLSALQLASQALPFAELGSEERQQAMLLIYRQTKHVSVVGLFDERGSSVEPPVAFPDPAAERMADHEAIARAGLEAYSKNVPLKAALSTGLAVGPVYVGRDPSGLPVPRLVVALTVPSASGERWVLAVEVSLRAVLEQFARYKVGERGHAFLVDAGKNAIAHRDTKVVLERQSLSGRPALSGGDEAWLGASAEVPLAGWQAAIEQPADEALAPVRRQIVSLALLLLVGLTAAALLGFTGVRAVTHPVQRLSSAAAKVAGGALDTQVHVQGDDEVSQLALAFNSMTRGLREREQLKQTFSRYVSDEVADRILQAPEKAIREELVKVTVMFIELRGLAAIAEGSKPKDVADLLSAYYELIVRVLMKNGGVVQKFIGGELMALFGAPQKLANAEIRALASALEIQHAVVAFNDVRRMTRQPTAAIAMGVSTGEAISCSLGSQERMEYSVVGDVIQIAQAMQQQAGDGQTYLSGATLQRVLGRFQVDPVGEVTPKGRRVPVPAVRLIGWSEGEEARRAVIGVTKAR